MVKAFITTIVGIAIIVGASIFENAYIEKTFSNFNSAVFEVYQKTENETATKEDVLAVQNLWIKNKKTLHVFIPHNDIKEFDLWISEAVSLVEKKMWEDALSKLEVVIEMTEQIPKTYTLRIENIL